MSGGGGGPSFESTPSWIIGVVVFIIVYMSLVVEKLLHHLGTILKKKDKIPLYEALEKIKEELMLMGFVSLLLAVLQDKVQKWCISVDLAKHWLPCHSHNSTSSTTTAHFSLVSNRGRHLLAEGTASFVCPEGKVSFVSIDVLHRLHYLIFILAIVHALTCTLTVVLGKVKINQWRKWEELIRAKNHLDDGKEKIINLQSLTFFRERFAGVDANKRNYVISFFKHLCGIVTKADYEAMRMGFILAHCNGDQTFHFHKYMVYAYEADFKKVVSINWFLWLLAVVSLSLNVAGWHIYTWISIVPLIRHTVIVGHVGIQPSDDYFWFKKPSILLVTIHIILFLNSFGLAVFIWTWTGFGFHSCIMGDAVYVYPRMVLLVVVQTICSYSTLPLYAVVTQMGSSYHEEAMERYGCGHSKGVT